MPLWVWVDQGSGNVTPESERDPFPFIFMSGAAFPASFLPILPLGFGFTPRHLFLLPSAFSGLL